MFDARTPFFFRGLGEQISDLLLGAAVFLNYVDRGAIAVDDGEIVDAVRLLAQDGFMIEPSGAGVTVASPRVFSQSSVLARCP